MVYKIRNQRKPLGLFIYRFVGTNNSGSRNTVSRERNLKGAPPIGSPIVANRRKSSREWRPKATHPTVSMARHVPIHIRLVNNTGRPICTLLAREDLRSRRRNSLSDDRYSVKIARKDRCQTRKRTRRSPLLLHSSSRAGLLMTRGDDLFVSDTTRINLLISL